MVSFTMNRRRTTKRIPLPTIALMAMVSIISFFAGSLWTMQARMDNMLSCAQSSAIGVGSDVDIESLVARRVQEGKGVQRGTIGRAVPCATELVQFVALRRVALRWYILSLTDSRTGIVVVRTELEKKSQGDSGGGLENGDTEAGKRNRFPKTTGRYAAGLARTKKQNFTKYMNLGVPPENTREGEEDILLLYATKGTLPTAKRKAVVTDGQIPELSTVEAVKNCDEVHVVLTDNTGRKKCVALVPQYESFHIFKYMRVAKDGGPLDHSQDLRYVSRGYQANGREKFRPPKAKDTKKLWGLLSNYISSIADVLDELKVACEKVVKDNTLIVMVCNFGQSELLMNFVCSAKGRGLDTSQILVFVTDKQTLELAESMGLVAFFDERVSNVLAFEWSCFWCQINSHTAVHIDVVASTLVSGSEGIAYAYKHAYTHVHLCSHADTLSYPYAFTLTLTHPNICIAAFGMRTELW